MVTNKYLRCFLLAIGTAGYVHATWALVDYSDSVGYSAAAPAPVSVSSPSSPAPAPRSTQSYSPSTARKANRSGSYLLQAGTRYSSLTVKSAQTETKVNKLDFNIKAATSDGLFVDLSYWQASAQGNELTTSEKTQKGNPLFLLGFNWFQLGSQAGAARADIYGGASMKASNSELGSSRNDTLVGMEIAKGFGSTAFVLGARYQLTGTPENTEEMKVGNITRFSLGLGYVVSHDIRFSLEGYSYQIRAAESDDSAPNTLKRDVSFSSIVPKLTLRLAPAIEMEMGGVFQGRRVSPEDRKEILKARLYDIEGAYGNSVFAGLRIAI